MITHQVQPDALQYEVSVHLQDGPVSPDCSALHQRLIDILRNGVLTIQEHKKLNLKSMLHWRI
jgi:hypothetical protein